jgi:hypothetical protein
MRLANLGVRMTKITLFIALGLSAFCAPAFAQHANLGGYAPMVGATDPCLLGTNVQPGACVGPVRVAPMIVSQGSVAMQPQHYAHQTVQAPQPTYVQQHAYVQPAAYVQPRPAPVQSSGCVPGYVSPSVPCNGNWTYAPQPVVQYAPAPQYIPAPVAYAPQPQQVGTIPTSFFTGAITYGAGFPTDTSYNYGGGGYGYSSGGTRFSGVRERSPTPLVAPPRRQRHAPPPKHHGCGC